MTFGAEDFVGIGGTISFFVLVTTFVAPFLGTIFVTVFSRVFAGVDFVTDLLVDFTAGLAALEILAVLADLAGLTSFVGLVGFTALTLGVDLALVVVTRDALPDALDDETFEEGFTTLAFGFSRPLVVFLVATCGFVLGFLVFLGIRDSFTDIVSSTVYELWITFFFEPSFLAIYWDRKNFRILAGQG